MQPTNVTVSTLFGNEVQFRIPLFQRHYVWELNEQWQPLWEDIEEKANQRALQKQRGESGHFTGAIVIQQSQTNVDEVNKYEIIDGQQRLTTFQIILCAIRDVCQSQDFNEIAEKVNDYILNKGMLTEEYDDEEYKLIPTDFDKIPLKDIVNGSPETELAEKEGNIHLAYTYFRTKINEYTAGNQKKILQLFHAILNDFGLVQILIDSDDEPEMIFESLNGRGKPLLQFDLLRNNLFLRTRISEDDRDKLYREYWSHFEADYWEAKVKVGRDKETLSEIFFQHFLMAKLGVASVSPLFNTYQREYRKGLSEGQNSKHELIELHRYSKTYMDISGPKSDIGAQMQFYKIFDITSLHPFVLYLMNDSQASKSEIELVFQILESYTIRRLLCTTQSHKNYNKFFSDMIRKFLKSGFSAREFVHALSRPTSDTSRWPSNSDVRLAFTGHWSEIKVNRIVIRYILYRIELQSRENNRFAEKNDLSFESIKSTLEHVLPIKWKENWRLPVDSGSLSYNELFSEEYRDNPLVILEPEKHLANPAYSDAYELARERDMLLQSIGNLTIVNRPLNSHMSNAPYSKKREALFSNSTLFLNKEIYKFDSWDIAEIQQRGQQLYTKFCDIWADAESFEKAVT